MQRVLQDRVQVGVGLFEVLVVDDEASAIS